MSQQIYSVGYGGHSMVTHLQSVLVRRPNKALAEANAAEWHYTSSVILPQAIQEHDNFVQILRNHGVDVVYHDQVNENLADAIFVHDPALITNQGAVILRMGKELRRGEEALMGKILSELSIPILGEVVTPGTAEGGDFLWLDDHTLLVGKSFRTNQAGISQVRQLLSAQKINVIDFDLPYFQGKDACLHLQSLISIVDVKTALVYLPLLPSALFELLQEREFSMIEVPEAEFYSMAPNTLAIKPKLVLSIEGNPITKQRLELAGIQVLTYSGSELSLKTEGGPTCLTKPLRRSTI